MDAGHLFVRNVRHMVAGILLGLGIFFFIGSLLIEENPCDQINTIPAMCIFVALLIWIFDITIPIPILN